jgi:secretion/DNA translocation related CpaE-like protein
VPPPNHRSRRPVPRTDASDRRPSAAGERQGGPAAAQVLVVSSDEATLDELKTLATAAGVRADVRAHLDAARSMWATADLVLVAADVLVGDRPPTAGSGAVANGALTVATVGHGSGGTGAGGATGLPRRGGVVLVARSESGGEVWRSAVELGAEHVAVLPAARPWLVERLADAASGRTPDAPTVGIVGGRGGAGASVLAAALARAAVARGQQTLLLDADPVGGGLDLVVGCEEVAGLRWPDLAAARGRLAGTMLRSALPDVDGLAVLSWDRGDAAPLSPPALVAVLDAARRSFELVVVDLPRHVDDVSRSALERCDQLLVVVPAEVRAAAAAARLLALVGPLVADIRLVVRGPAPTGLPAEAVAQALGLPLAGELRPEPGLDAALDRGAAPATSARSPLAALSRRLLTQLPRRDAGAA